MPTNDSIPWTISSAGDWTETHRHGRASTRADAWLAALAAGRAALLTGDLVDIAIAVDDALPTALYFPARNEDGTLDPIEVTAAFVEIYQGETAADVAARIIGSLPA